jgi:hypothetical protein
MPHILFPWTLLVHSPFRRMVGVWAPTVVGRSVGFGTTKYESKYDFSLGQTLILVRGYDSPVYPYQNFSRLMVSNVKTKGKQAESL